MGFAGRVRRLVCLLSLLVGIIVPMALKVFFVADTSQLSYSWESRLRSIKADDFIGKQYAQSTDSEKILASILSDKTMTPNKSQRNLQDHFIRINVGHNEFSPVVVLETFELQNNIKRNIHAVVTTIVAFTVPFVIFLYAFIFLRKPQGSDPSTYKRMRRKERILRALVECRIQLPKTSKVDDTTTTNQDSRRECTICLCDFAEGEAVIASKHCHCSIPHIDSTNRTDRIGSATGTSITQAKYHRICFHEKCIFTWLSQRESNPKKLCPCCRQPFFASTITSKTNKIRR